MTNNQVIKEIIRKDQCFAYAIKNNVTLSEAMQMFGGKAYEWFWANDVNDEDAKSILAEIENEIKNLPKKFYANAKRTFGDYYAVGYQPVDLEECNPSEMLAEDIDY